VDESNDDDDDDYCGHIWFRTALSNFYLFICDPAHACVHAQNTDDNTLMLLTEMGLQ